MSKKTASSSASAAAENSRRLRHAVAALPRRLKPRAKSLIMTVWGDAIAPHGGTVWLGSLIRLLAPLGLNERLVRTGVLRLVRDGWLAAEPLGREAGQLRERVHAPGHRGAVPAQIPGHQGHIGARGEVREESAVLDHVADPQPHRPDRVRDDRHAVEENRARVRPDEPDEEAQEGGLPAPAGADQHGRPTGRQLQRERAEDRPPRDARLLFRELHRIIADHELERH